MRGRLPAEQGGSGMEQKQLYREASLKSIRSPEELNQYLRVTNLSVWLLLGAVILLLAGLLVWGSFTYIDHYSHNSLYPVIP